MTLMGSENAAYGLSQYYEDELLRRHDPIGGPASADDLAHGWCRRPVSSVRLETGSVRRCCATDQDMPSHWEPTEVEQVGPTQGVSKHTPIVPMGPSVACLAYRVDDAQARAVRGHRLAEKREGRA